MKITVIMPVHNAGNVRKENSIKIFWRTSSCVLYVRA